MSETYLKEWLNIYLKLSKEIKDIPSDFSNGYLFGEILHRHKLIPNFDSYKNTNEKTFPENRRDSPYHGGSSFV